MPSMKKPGHAMKLHRETENFALLSRDLATRSAEWYSRPTEIEFAFNNFCNLRCVMCGKSDDAQRETLDREVGIRAIEELLPNALHLTPSSYSEPFLNDLDLVTDLCARHDVSLFIFTNGLLCTEERFRKIQPAVDQLWFSFDSHIRETYERIRAGSRFDTVVENMRRTVALAEEDGTEICFQPVLMRWNVRELPDYVRFIASLGGRRINVAELIPYSSAYDEIKIEGAVPDSEVLRIIETACAAALENGIDLTLKLRPPFGGEALGRKVPKQLKKPIAALREVGMSSMARIYPFFCTMAAHYVKISPNGDLFPCCRSPQSLRMGNLHERSFEGIWNGEAYRSFRKEMMEGRYDPACRACPIFTAPGAVPGDPAV
ncbi:MAG: radical SAM protein [Planctomycetota bacterium]